MSKKAKAINLDDLRLPYADIESAIKMFDHFGNKVGLVDLCNLIGRDDLPIRPQDRKLLADFIRSNMMMKPRRGRPRDDFEIRWVYPSMVAHVRILKATLKAEGRKVPADEVVAWVAQKHGVDFETLNNHVRRSSNTRKRCRIK